METKGFLSLSQASFDEQLLTYLRGLRVTMQGEVDTLDARVESLLSDKRFSKWRTYQELRWTRQKEDQCEHWKRMLTEQVTNKYMYSTFLEQYKERMRNETQAFFAHGAYETYSEERKNNMFEEMFQRLVEIAAAEHPSMAVQVEGKIYTILCSNKSLPWKAKFVSSKLWKSLVQESIDLPRNILSILFGGYNHRRHETLLVQNIIRAVSAKIQAVNKYSDDVVLDCLELGTKELQKVERGGHIHVSRRLRQNIYDFLLSYFVKELRSIQETWDQENNTSVRFAVCKDDMRSYFKSLGPGVCAQELLVTMLQDHFARNVRKGFEVELATNVGMKLKVARWVGNADVMQAYMDKDLMDKMLKGDISGMLDGIQRPEKHFREVAKSLINREVSKVIEKVYTSFRMALKGALIESARMASNATSRRAELFLSTLKKELTNSLMSRNNCLTDRLPRYDDNFDCDSQPPTIFTTENPNIPSSITQKIPEKHTCDMAFLNTAILEYMRDYAYGVSDGIRPRCGSPCPLCGCACVQAAGHQGRDGEKLHDTYHQPRGLIGGYEIRTDELDFRSCSMAAADNWSFRLDDGNWHKFEDFSKVFTEWAQPVARRPLKFREYIFWNYQRELRRLYPERNTCTDIPNSYNHSLDKIRDEIEELTGVEKMEA